jgi:DNA polymerase III subunit delta
MRDDDSAMAVHHITGDDESLLLTATTELVHRLVGDGDRSLMVDDFDGPDYELAAVVDAAQTPPFLTDRRVVVARGIGRFTVDQVESLVAYLPNPLESTELVLVGGGGKIPKSLADTLKKVGAHVTDTVPPTKAKDRTAWVQEQLSATDVRVDGAALQLIAGWMGEDAGMLQGLLDTLASTYGSSRALKADDVRPFLGDAGGVPPWDLTDAIDRGDTTKALTLLHRMMGGGERHPLQIMAILHNHYARMLRLDGADVRDDNAAAQLLGVKSPFAAGKSLTQSRRLGSSGVARAIGLLAQADLDLRGAKDWPADMVMEVLVARLSKLGSGRR